MPPEQTDMSSCFADLFQILMVESVNGKFQNIDDVETYLNEILEAHQFDLQFSPESRPGCYAEAAFQLLNILGKGKPMN